MNVCTFGDGPDPSPPRSDNLRTWLAVIPSVTCCDGNECFRVSRHGDNRYGLSGDPISKLSRGVDWFVLTDALASYSSPVFDSSTTILKPSCPLKLDPNCGFLKRPFEW